MRSYVDRRAGRYIHSKLTKASESVYICTPYIDRKYVDEIVSLTRRNILVKLITGSSQKSFNLRAYLLTHTLDSQYFKHVITPRQDFVHAKIVIVDEKYAIDGSANLTKNGLWHQVNYTHVYEELDEVREVINAFEKIWTYNEKHISEADEERQLAP